MGFDVQGARAAGYSDTEIADHLAAGAKFNAKQARAAGYSDAEIIDHLMSPDTPGSDANRALHAQRLAAAQAELAEAKSPIEGGKRALQAAGDYIMGTAETGANLATQMLSTPVAGLAGLVTSPLGFIPGMEGVGARNTERVARALTYEPKSDVGKESVKIVSKPFVWFAGKADQAGDAVRRATGSELLATATNTAIQAVPAFLSRGTRRAFTNVGSEVAATAGRAIRGRGAAAATSGAQAAAAEAQSTAAAAASAENYARSIGIDWARLSDEVRGKLTAIAQSAGELDRLDPAAVKRLAELQSLKVAVPATRGALERDPVQMRNEGNAAATAEGQPIRDIQIAGDNALQANLDVLRGRVAGRGTTAAAATTPEEAGAVVQGAARAKEAASKANYDRLYKAARETEPDARASVTPVTDLLTQNPEIQHLGWVQTWLNRAAKAAGAKEGEPVAITDATMRELADLRSQATAIARTGGKEGYYAGEVVRAIDSTMESVPAAAKAWRAANEAYRAHKTEFAEQGAVGDLVDQTSRTDRATALEKTVDTITSGSLEDIRKVKRTLLTGGDEATRAAGRKAMREIRTQVLDRIKREATKSATEKADGTPNLSVDKLKKVIDSYGPEKLDEIFGPGNAREIYRILDAAKVIKTLPAPGTAVGSTTLQNILVFLGKGLDKVPVVGRHTTDFLRGAATVKEFGAKARTSKAATTTPLDEALSGAAKRGRAKVRREAAAVPFRTSPISSLSAGENQQ